MIYIVENNRFGMGTAWERASSLYDISQKATAYDMPSAVADGMDVLDMRRVTLEAVERARKDKIPTLIEARCHRFMGHSMSDPGNYRTREEIAKYQERDPIVLFRDSLTEAELLTDKEFEEIEKRAVDATAAAVAFADDSPFPDASELLTDVYA